MPLVLGRVQVIVPLAAVDVTVPHCVGEVSPELVE